MLVRTEMHMIVAVAAGVILFGIFSSFLIGRSQPAAAALPHGSWACTADAYTCPDGSTVGRVPPYCQFALCDAQ